MFVSGGLTGGPKYRSSGAEYVFRTGSRRMSDAFRSRRAEMGGRL